MRETIENIEKYINSFACQYSYSTCISEAADTLFVNIDLGRTDGGLSIPVEVDLQFPIDKYDGSVEGRRAFDREFIACIEDFDIEDYLERFQTEENEEIYGGGNLATLLYDAAPNVRNILDEAISNIHVHSIENILEHSDKNAFFMDRTTGAVLGIETYFEKKNGETLYHNGPIFKCIHYDAQGAEIDWAGDWYNLDAINTFDIREAEMLGLYDSVEDCYKEHGEKIAAKINAFENKYTKIADIDLVGITPANELSYQSEYPCYLNKKGDIVMIEICEVETYEKEYCDRIGNPGLEYGALIYEYDGGYHCEECSDWSGTSLNPDFILDYCGMPVADLGRHEDIEDCIKANTNLLKEFGYNAINLDEGFGNKEHDKNDKTKNDLEI